MKTAQSKIGEVVTFHGEEVEVLRVYAFDPYKGELIYRIRNHARGQDTLAHQSELREAK